MAIYDKEGNLLSIGAMLEDIYGFDTKIDSYDPKTTVVKLTDQKGKPRELNLTNFLSKLGIKIGKSTSINTQDMAIQESPATLLDRLKMSFSVNQDRPAGIKKIRPDFQDAQMNEDGTLVVLDKGIWKRVDPTGMDPGDIADMVGYLLPYGLGATALAASTPTAIPSAGVAPTAFSALAGVTGELGRQRIGEALGVKKGGIHRPTALLEGASWLATPIVNKALGKTWSGGKEGIKNIAAMAFEYTSGIPREVTKAVLNDPSILTKDLPAMKNQLDILRKMPNKPTKVTLPSGEIYELSAQARNELIKALKETGKEIETVVATSPKIKDLKINKNEFLGELLTRPEKVVNEHWGGVDRFTPKQRAFIADLAQDLDRKAGTQTVSEINPELASKVVQKGAKPEDILKPESNEYVSFEKLHNIKQKIYNFIDFDSEGNEGDAFLLDYAKKINDVLGEKSAPYKDANTKYGTYRQLANNFFKRIPLNEDKVGMQKATEGISSYMEKVAKGVARPSQQSVLDQLEEQTGVKISTKAKNIMAKNLQKRESELVDIATRQKQIGALSSERQRTEQAQKEFSKGPQLGRTVGLASLPIISGAAQALGGGGMSGIQGATGIAPLALALSWPQVIKSGLLGTTKAVETLKPVQNVLGQAVATPTRRTLLSKSLSDLLSKRLQ